MYNMYHLHLPIRAHVGEHYFKMNTLKEKYEIVHFLEKNSSMKRKDIASKFSIPESTLSRQASKFSELTLRTPCATKWRAYI